MAVQKSMTLMLLTVFKWNIDGWSVSDE